MHRSKIGNMWPGIFCVRINSSNTLGFFSHFSGDCYKAGKERERARENEKEAKGSGAETRNGLTG